MLPPSQRAFIEKYELKRFLIYTIYKQFLYLRLIETDVKYVNILYHRHSSLLIHNLNSVHPKTMIKI